MQSHKLRDIIICTVISIISLMLSIHLSLFADESFTMSLIRHSYRNIIDLDMLDIHPPLYYLILKLVLNITTLDSNNIIIDIIIARLFSFTCFFLSFMIACRVLKVMKLHYNTYILYTLLIILMLYTQELASIRMYALATLFITLEFYNLVKFIYYHQNQALCLLTFFAILAAYTHDYAALLAGSLILLTFGHACINKSSNVYKWLLAGSIFFIAYFPWLKIALYQAFNLPSHYWIIMINSLQDSLLFATFLLFSYPIFNTLKRINSNNQFIYQLLTNTYILILLIELILTIHQPIFILRYVSPLLFIYITVTYGLFINQKSYQVSSVYAKTIILIFLLVITINIIYINVHSQERFHYQTIQLERVFNKSSYHVHINTKEDTQNNILHLCQFNTFAQYKNKALPHKENMLIFNNKNLQQGTSSKLMKKLWATRH